MPTPTVDLRCAICGPVAVDVCHVEVHINHRDGFRLLSAPCPLCEELISCRDKALLDRAIAFGASRLELLDPLPALTHDDLLAFHELLADDEWCTRLTDAGS